MKYKLHINVGALVLSSLRAEALETLSELPRGAVDERRWGEELVEIIDDWAEENKMSLIIGVDYKRMGYKSFFEYLEKEELDGLFISPRHEHMMAESVEEIADIMNEEYDDNTIGSVRIEELVELIGSVESIGRA